MEILSRLPAPPAEVASWEDCDTFERAPNARLAEKFPVPLEGPSLHELAKGTIEATRMITPMKLSQRLNSRNS